MINSSRDDFYLFIGESKKRMYLMTAKEDGSITGYRMFPKQKDEGYFLIYDEAEGRN